MLRLVYSRVLVTVRNAFNCFKKMLGMGEVSDASNSQIANLKFIYEVVFGGIDVGTFVEVGAHDGVKVSNTCNLAWAGWKGLLIEPNPKIASLAKLNFYEYENITVHSIAMGEPGVEEIDLHLAGLLSSANINVIKEYESISWAHNSLEGTVIRVPCTTLDNFLTSNSINQGFELLVVDVEGYERAVFKGFNLEFWKPLVIIIELSNLHPDISTVRQDHAILQSEISNVGYQILYKDSINTLFCRSDLYWQVFCEN